MCVCGCVHALVCTGVCEGEMGLGKWGEHFGLSQRQRWGAVGTEREKARDSERPAMHGIVPHGEGWARLIEEFWLR